MMVVVVDYNGTKFTWEILLLLLTKQVSAWQNKSNGTWELVIDVRTKTIVHFLIYLNM